MEVIKSEYLDADRLTLQQLFEGAMYGMVDKLDAHSSFISRAEKKRFQEGLDQVFGGVDVLVNNAGIFRDQVIWKMSDEQWQDVIDV
ncbi:MAG: SDR family NAD(P)-dependent oxidoreductase, partial [Planctomycetes bacterium]|nr:SDR family NAD(P)-dependent oxidoreductase [Planctomycetota bacterium]